MEYRRDIDGLRAVAVLPVVFYHAGLSGFSGGFVGVDIFFVISGYVISCSILADLDSGVFSLWRFYERRVRRIFPALIVMSVCSYIAATVLFIPSYFVDFSKSIVSTSTFVANVFFWKNVGYFDIEAHLRPLLHTWSLAVEEQFYLFAPMFMWLVYCKIRGHWLETIAPALILSLALSIYTTRVATSASFFLLPTRAWELLVGVLLALRPLPPLHPWLNEAVSVMGLAAIVFSVATFSDATAFPGANALYPCFGAAMIIYTGSGNSGSLVTTLMSSAPLVFVGLISYSLYLVHWPLFVFTRYVLLRDPTGFQVVLLITASFVLAILSWRLVERPFRNPKWASRLQVLGFGGAAMAAIATLGVIGVEAGGFPFRSPALGVRLAETDDQWKTHVCFLESDDDPSRWSMDTCTRAGHAGPKVLLWGDSFAAHFVPGFIAIGDRLAARIVQYTFAGCPPLLDYESLARPHCREFNAGALKLMKRAGIKIAILSARWELHRNKGLASLRETVDTLREAGITVYVLGQSPEFTMDVQVLAYRSGDHSGRQVLAWTPEVHPDLNAEVRALAGQAIYIDPISLLCNDGLCPYRTDVGFLYLDYGHLSRYGAKLAVQRLFPFFLFPEQNAAIETWPTAD